MHYSCAGVTHAFTLAIYSLLNSSPRIILNKSDLVCLSGNLFISTGIGRVAAINSAWLHRPLGGKTRLLICLPINTTGVCGVTRLGRPGRGVKTYTFLLFRLTRVQLSWTNGRRCICMLVGHGFGKTMSYRIGQNASYLDIEHLVNYRHLVATKRGA